MSTRLLQMLACSLLLSACTPAPQEAPVPEAPAPAPVVTEALPYDTTNSIKDLMTTMIVPNAQALWNSVSYVVTSEGATETLPQTDEDWTRLRASAIALIEGGNALMVPGREVVGGFAVAGAPAFQFTPEEIAQRVADDPQVWLRYVQELQESTRLTLQAIELRDVMGLTEWGAQINDACEGCHAQFWYRPQGDMPQQ